MLLNGVYFNSVGRCSLKLRTTIAIGIKCRGGHTAHDYPTGLLVQLGHQNRRYPGNTIPRELFLSSRFRDNLALV